LFSNDAARAPVVARISRSKEQNMSTLVVTSSHPASNSAKGAFPLLLLVGSLLAIAVLLSKIAASSNAPMLSYLSLAMGGSGLVLTAMPGGIRSGAGLARLLPYSLVAGALMALGSALGYLTVHKVGAAFIALALAFPPMLTWLLSLILRIETFDGCRLSGLLAGLAGGVLLALGKGIGAPASEVGSILLACSMPAVLALGNVFRTRYWPKGASARELAGLMLLCGAALTLPFALWLDGPAALGALFHLPVLVILLAAIISFVAQYSAFFKLQQIAGPVYLSQIGSIAALFGGPAAVVLLGEHLPQGFAVAALLIVTGLAVFQSRAAQHH
jgi:drug/metabolite transporter (DMT)-like permease